MDEFLRNMEIAVLLGISHEELAEADWELIDEINGETGIVNYLLVHFHSSTPKHILAKIQGLDDTNTVWLNKAGTSQ